MGKWSSILKLGSKAANSSAARTVGGAVIHPQRTLMGVGAATKTAVVGTGMGYVAWESIVNDKPVVRTIGDTLIGEKAVDKTVDAASSVADTVGTVTGKVGDTLKSVNEATSSVTETWGGIGSFLRNITGGNGLNMFGNLFNNIASGNVSGMSMLGLLLSGLLVFGRFGWMGKIAGALMGMMLIGSNSQSQSVAQTQEVTQLTGLKR
jgi:hypothetical protein